MAPLYKLTYFNVPSAAEPIRYLFHYAGIEFEDIKITRAQWPDIQPDMPFGRVPILEYNGKVVCQSKAICKYIAKMVDLVGRDAFEDLEIDSIVDTFYDFRMKFSFWLETDEKVKQEEKDMAINEFIPFYMPKFDAIVKQNNGFFVGGRLTWADIYVVSIIDVLSERAGTDITENCPNIRKLKKYVESIEGIKNYLANRTF